MEEREIVSRSAEIQLEGERWRLLRQFENALELPMIILGFVWLVLLILEFTIESPGAILLNLSTGIWVIFILDFLVKFTIAPKKKKFLIKNWLTIVALALPALRIFRIARLLRILRLGRATRSFQLVRLVGSFNRGMRSLRRTMRRRSFGYVVALTVLVVCIGALGMQFFERSGSAGEYFDTYWESLWWTSMLLTTIGSQAWPQTVEGRVLALLLSLYAIGVFGYVAGLLASFFIGRDEEEGDAASMAAIAELKKEIRQLRSEIEAGSGQTRQDR